MTHLLDTNICIYLIKNKPESLLRRLQSKDIEQMGISAITLSELEYGVAKSQYSEKNSIALIEFLTPFRILDFDQTAAHAIAKNLILVTNNAREFRRVPALNIENWVVE